METSTIDNFKQGKEYSNSAIEHEIQAEKSKINEAPNQTLEIDDQMENEPEMETHESERSQVGR